MAEPRPGHQRKLRSAPPPPSPEQASQSESTDVNESSSDDWTEVETRVKRKDRAADVAIKPKPGTLFATVLQGHPPVGVSSLVADTWIKKYQGNRDDAWLELASFLFHCTGCRGVITPVMLQTMDSHSLTGKMIEDFGEVSSSYPLDEPTETWKKFRENLSFFIQNLIHKCHHSILYDDFLMEKLSSLLLVWVESTCHTFRHTATFIIVKIATVLYATTKKLNEQASKLKHGASRDELKRNADTVHEIFGSLINPITTLCCRDTVPAVNSICITEICKWMKIWPENFIQSKYLNCVARLLTDGEPISLDACLQALKPLYGSVRFVSLLKEFTTENKDRFVAMLYKPQFNVALGALNIVTSIFEHKYCTVSQGDFKKIHALVFCKEQVVARAAAKFMNDTFFIGDSSEAKLVKLAQFFIDSVEDDLKMKYRCPDFVDSFLESRCMKDWTTMVKILGEEQGSGEQPPVNQRQQQVLIEIMLNCVQRAATGMPLKGRERSRSSQPSKIKLKEISRDKEIFTQLFMDTLPRLLIKNMAYPKHLIHLLEIAEYLELGMYRGRRMKLQLLKETVETVFNTHSDTDVLTACMRTYIPLCDRKFALHAECIQSLILMKDRTAERFRQAYETLIVTSSKGDTLSEQDASELTICLKKLREIFFYHVLAIGDLFPVLIELVKQSIREKGGILAEAASHAITCCYRGLRGEYLNLNMANPNWKDVEKVRLALRELVPVCETLLLSGIVCLQEASYSGLCEILLIFGKKLSGTILACWEMQATTLHSDRLMNFVQKSVFIEMEPEIDRDEYAKAREQAKRSFFLMTFCTLIEKNIFPASAAADVFKHYHKYYDLYNKQIRSTIQVRLSNDHKECSRAMNSGLVKLFESLPQMGDSPIDRKSAAFKSIVECAKRFARILGRDPIKIRNGVFALLNDGILFSGGLSEENPVPVQFGRAPRNIAYLDVMKMFVCKLEDDDLPDLRECIKTYFPGEALTTVDDGWKPLQEFYRRAQK